MPKETFFRLEKDKKEKIEQALLQEFSRVTFDKASISNIVEQAKIPRGSFYQYFEDKEDAVSYIIEQFMQKEKEQIDRLLKKNKGNIFETAFSIFDYTIDKINQEEEMRLCKNILEELKKQNISIFENHKERKIQNNEFIDQSLLNLQQEEDLKYIMKILTSTVRNTAIEVISKKTTKEEGRKSLKRQIEILKRGMAK